MKAQPKKGDVITIGRGKTRGNVLLVINAEVKKEYDGVRRDTVPYSCYQFQTIPVPEREGSVNPTVTTWTLMGGSMHGPNEIDLEAINLLARVNVLKYVETRYTLSEKDLATIKEQA